VIVFLREENRVLKAHLRGRRLRLSDHERRRLAAIGHRIGRRTLRDVATIAAPDTILRWHRDLVVGQRPYAGRRPGRPRVHAQIRCLAVRMATENATWGYTRIQGALKNLGHHVGRSTIARILKEHGVPPSRHRPMAWPTFVRAHWPALIDLFQTEISTIRRWVTYCTAFLIGLCSRRVYRVGSTPRTNDQPFLHRMRQCATGIDGLFGRPHPGWRSQMMPNRGPLACTGDNRIAPGGQMRDVCGPVGVMEAVGVSGRRADLSPALSSTDTHLLGREQSHRTEPSTAGAENVLTSYTTARSEPADRQRLLWAAA
jgi:hypothetical protein